MEAIELSGGNEIQDYVSARLHGISDSYSILKVGHITKFVEPLTCSLAVSEALEAFAAQPEVESLPVEGESGVIGLLRKKDLLKRKSGFMSDPHIEKFVDTSNFSINASENCEKAMALILSRDKESVYDDFMVYERGRFFGIGSFADLSKAISEIRAMDLVKAKRMQEYLVSRNSICGGGIRVKTYVSMAHEIGGDYLACLDLSDTLSLLSCYDVCGKGTAAALLTSTVSAFFSTLKASGALAAYKPAALVRSLNDVVLDQTSEELFIAAAFAFVDRATRAVTVYNCGFAPIYAFYADPDTGKPKGRMIKPDLMPLGIDSYAELKGVGMPFYPGLRFFLHSDGLTDACEERGERYGDERLRKFLYPRCMNPVDSLVTELEAEIRDYVGLAPQADDITVLAAEIG
jgi:serine phosphatase RsbU (regulator of sigma subunit)